MMPIKDVLNFTRRHFQNDRRHVFFFRIVRLLYIGLFYFSRNKRTVLLRKESTKFPIVTISTGGAPDFQLHIDRDDPGISTDLYLDHTRETDIAQHLPLYLKEGDTVIDIGANIGFYVVQESMLVGPSGRVHAIEPVSQNFELLASNIQLNDLKNVSTYKTAVGDSNRTDYMFVSSMRNMHSMVRKVGYRSDFNSKIPVQVRTLDFLIESKVQSFPSLIRMDVEGFEYQIVQGMKDTLAGKHHFCIFMELHCDILMNKVSVLARQLKEAGFETAVATFETHPAVPRWGKSFLKYLDCKMGLDSGVINIEIDDLIQKSEFNTGEVEYVEVIFRR
jgi:FkbM family methyltransferase